MKKIILKLLIVLFVCTTFTGISAETEYEDMSVWSLKILLQNCDQKPEIKVVRYLNSSTGRVGFCVEPEVNYNRFDYVYTKDSHAEDEVFKIVRAYEEFNDDEHFIAAQLMIWQTVSGNIYTFEGKGADDYGKADLEQLIQSYNDEQNINYQEIDAEDQKTNTFNIENLNDYTIESEDVSIISKSDNSFDFTVNDPDKEENHIYLRSRIRRGNGAFLYHSDGSQDLYSYEGDYAHKNDIDIKLNVIKNEDLAFSFTKTDNSGYPISGAQFCLYDLSPDAANETMYIIQKDKSIDLFKTLAEDYPNYDLSKVEIRLSERYQKYLQGTVINASETGVFPFTVYYNGEVLRQGKVFVFSDQNQTLGEYRKLKVRQVSSAVSSDNDINLISPGKKDHQYYLCETMPANGYDYSDDPCKIIDTTKDDYDKPYNFINNHRNYTLQLIKNDPDHIYKLNGARFEMEYDDGSQLHKIQFVTGALNFIQTKDRKYVIYRYEHFDDVKVAEFKDPYLIIENVPYGRYYYYLSNDQDIDLNKLKNKYIDVSEGAYMIANLPYNASVRIRELKAPNGYHIDSETYTLIPDIGYDQITYTNSRVNTAEIIPENRRKIPKTCIGD